jgi:FkbM family methyltransferase
MIAALIRAFVRPYVRYGPKVGRHVCFRAYRKFAQSLPHQATVTTKSGLRMRLTMPDTVSSTIYLTGLWERCISAHVEKSLRPGDLFVDVGANIGYFTLLASKAVGQSGTVVAVEASPSIFRRLEANVHLNGCTNVELRNTAAGAGPGTVSMFLAGGDLIAHSTTMESLARQEGMTLEASVPADTLEAIVGERLFQARIVKVDVEGAERLVLGPLFDKLGAFANHTEWLLEFAPEFADQKGANEIFEAFRAAGYRAFSIPNRYDEYFWLGLRRGCELKRIDDAPTSLTDVLMTRLI